MKKIIRTALTAGLLAFFAAANAQQTDTTGYSNKYSQDTTSYDSDREQQGSDTYNDTQNETEYSNTQSSDRYNRDEQTDDQSDYPQGRNNDQDTGNQQGRNDQHTIEQGVDPREYQEDESRSGMYDDPTTRPGYDEEQERARNRESGSTLDRSETDQEGTEDQVGDSRNQGMDQTDQSRSGTNNEPLTQPGWEQDGNNTQDRSTTDRPEYGNQSSDYDTNRDHGYTQSDQDSLETGNQKDDQSQYPETSPSQRGWNQEAGTEPVENDETSIHDQQDPVKQEGRDKNKDYNHTGDQSYNDEQPRDTGIGSDDGIGPESDEAHRQAREELSHATDTLDYASQRNADPDKAGNRVENMADTVNENAHERDKARHGMED